MMKLKNPAHEKFAQVWHETGRKSDAFRESHPHSLKWKDATVHNKASALSKKGEIAARFEQLQEEQLKGHHITVASLIAELDEAREVALGADTPQSGAAITATMSKAKLVGLDKHIVEVKATVETRNTLDDFYG